MVRENRLDQEKWSERAGMVAEFVARYRRLPRPGDGAVGAWLSSQRSDLHAGKMSMTSARQAVLDSVAAGWREFLPPLTWTWPERAEQLRGFRDQEGRWPSQTANDPDERSLARWLSMQRTKAHQGGLPEGKLVALDQFAQGWDRGSRKALWIRNADALGLFVREKGRWPSKNSALTEERRLGAWLHNRRQDARTGVGWTDERAAYLEIVAPGWNG